jgi:pyoverdine/dityrosine biosynthesis protein Dit1
VIICSDGHVFSDLVGVSDEQVARYGEALEAMIDRLGAHGLSRFSMKSRRAELDPHLEPLEEIEARIGTDPETRALFCGIQRFLFEDRVVLERNKSRNRVRTECKRRAIALIQRSRAWSSLIRARFPTALRLSIHPQHPHAEKIGILLSEAKDVWLTPWHGVALEERGRFKLVKRFEAEAIGARIVERGGRPSHFEVASEVAS